MAAPKLVCSVLIFVACFIIGISSIVGATTWCVATRFATPYMLQKQMDFLCSHGTDCSAIQEGGSCFFPNTLYAHASYAFNSYYVRTGGGDRSLCFYGGTATITTTNPSFGSCKYPSSK